MQSLRWAHRWLWLDVTIYIVFLLVFLLTTLTPFHKVAWDGHQMINILTKCASDRLALSWAMTLGIKACLCFLTMLTRQFTRRCGRGVRWLTS